MTATTTAAAGTARSALPAPGPAGQVVTVDEHGGVRSGPPGAWWAT